jgi:hypothetical protein
MALNIENNQGLAFHNTKGLMRNEKAPTFKGEIMFEGRRLEVVVWERQTKTGNKMLSMAVEDAHAAQIERAERTLNYLRNKSEGDEPERGDDMVKVDESQDDHIKRTATKKKVA